MLVWLGDAGLMLVGWVGWGGWLVGWLAGWLVCWLVGWEVGDFFFWLVVVIICCSLLFLLAFLIVPAIFLVYVGTFCIFLSFEQSLFLCFFHKGVEALMWLVTFGWGCWSDSLYI